MLRRLGYVRLRDYNLRATSDGMLVPISSDRPVPIDLSVPAQLQPQRWPPPAPPQLAEGTVDGLDSVPVVPATRWPEVRTTRRVHAVPPPPAPFADDDPELDELPYRPWTEEPD